jgi:hypothetical protein
MLTSERDAIRAVELAIIACEGGLVVDGVPYSNNYEADRARRAVAERAVAESGLLRRWVAIRPPCPWCGESITADDTYVEIAGVRVHSTTGRPCAGEYSASDSACYAATRSRALHLVHGP